MQKKSLNQVLAENLRVRMEGWTQTSLAEKSGVAQTTISLYMNPQRRNASSTGREPSAKLAEVEKLAAALGCNPLALLVDKSAHHIPFDLIDELSALDESALPRVEDMLRGALAVLPRRQVSKHRSAA